MVKPTYEELEQRLATAESELAASRQQQQQQQQREHMATSLQRDRERSPLSAAQLATWDWQLPDGEIRWNDEHYRMLGYAVGEVTPSYAAWAERIHPEDRPATEAAFRHSLEPGGSYITEFRSLWPDGTVHWLEARGRVERDSAGKPVRSYGMMAEVTDRKQAEEELHASEARFRDIATASADWIWEIDAADRYTFASASVTAALGYEPAEMLDRDITDRKRMEESLRELNATLEYKVAERTAEVVAASQKVQGERQRLYDVLETLPVYVILLSEDHHVPFANRFFEGRFGKSEGRRCYEYLFSRTEPCENCESFKPFKTGQPHHWYWTGPDGRDYDIYDYPFTDSDGSQRVMEMGIDITEARKAQAALHQANEQLSARAAQLRALAGELTLSEQRERRRMARLLHDHLQQLLVGAKFRVTILGRHVDSVVQQAAQEVGRLTCRAIRQNDLLSPTADLELQRNTDGRPDSRRLPPGQVRAVERSRQPSVEPSPRGLGELLSGDGQAAGIRRRHQFDSRTLAAYSVPGTWLRPAPSRQSCRNRKPGLFDQPRLAGDAHSSGLVPPGPRPPHARRPRGVSCQPAQPGPGVPQPLAGPSLGLRFQWPSAPYPPRQPLPHPCRLRRVRPGVHDGERSLQRLCPPVPAVSSVAGRGARPTCGCAASRDIGEYDTCPHGCVYCYAVASQERARQRFREHDPSSEFLFKDSAITDEPEQIPDDRQLPLF